MQYKYLDFKLPLAYDEELVRKKIKSKLNIVNFSYFIDKQSLDPRNKKNIHWQTRVLVKSEEITKGDDYHDPKLVIEKKDRNAKVAIIGFGPAGFFAAYVLALSGFEVVVFEQGFDVNNRAKAIDQFERKGKFDYRGSYPFGEGGAGTFSDGKLTSRTKNIKEEKKFVLETYVKYGAPEEILYLQKPHIGTDNLKKICVNLRKELLKKGGKVFFDTKVTKVYANNLDHKITKIETSQGLFEADYFIFATGNSSYDSLKMLLDAGIHFSVKPFAIGARVEHLQAEINKAQWGKTKLKGLKAADYTLSYYDKTKDERVFSFCMCPGGKIVPSTGYQDASIVNGMSYYKRDGLYANSAIVSAFDIEKYLKREVDPKEALDWLYNLEQKFYQAKNGFEIPYMKIKNFIAKGNYHNHTPETSYPLGIYESDYLNELMPPRISKALRNGLKNFSNKIKGFENGLIMGLESKTSNIVRASRDRAGKIRDFENCFVIGEGSGYSGGITSSAVDGVKAALSLIERF